MRSSYDLAGSCISGIARRRASSFPKPSRARQVSGGVLQARACRASHPFNARFVAVPASVAWSSASVNMPAFVAGIVCSFIALYAAHLAGQLISIIVKWLYRTLAARILLLRQRALPAREDSVLVSSLRKEAHAQQAQAIKVQADLDGARSRIAQLESDAKDAHAQAAKLKNAHEEELLEMNSTITQAARKLTTMDELLAALNGRLKTEQARARELEALAESLRGQLAASAALRTRSKAGIADMNKAKRAAETKVAELEAELAKTNEQLDSAKEGQEELKSAVAEATGELRRSAALHEEETEELSRRVAQLQAELADAQTELGVMRLDLEAAQVQQQDMSDSYGAATGSLEDVQAALAAARNNLTATKAAFNEVNNAKLALHARLKATEVQSAAVKDQVDKLTMQLSSAKDADERKREASELLSRELSNTRRALEVAKEEARRAKAASVQAERVAEEAASQNESLQLKEELIAARNEVAVAQQALLDMEGEVADVISHVLAQAIDASSAQLRDAMKAVEADAQRLSAEDVAVMPLPDRIVQQRLCARQAELQELEAQIAGAVGSLPESAKEQHKQLLDRLDATRQRRFGLAMMKIPEERAERESELAAEEAAQRDRILAFLKRALPNRSARQLAGMEATATRVRREVDALTRAAQTPLRDRLQALMLRQVATLRTILLEEVARIEERSAERVAATRADADAAAQESMERTKAVAQQQEVEMRERSRQEREQVEELRRVAAEERAELADETRRIAGERAALEQSKAYVHELLSAHGPLELLGTKEAALAQRHAQLKDREARVAEREFESRQALETSSRQAEQVAQELIKLRALQERINAEQASLTKEQAAAAEEQRRAAAERREAERLRAAQAKRGAEAAACMAEEQRTREVLLAEQRRQAEEEIGQMKARAQADADLQAAALKEERAAIAVERAEVEERVLAASGEAARSREELEQLRERVNSQFRASKQELETVQAECRRLRQQLAARPTGTDAPTQRLEGAAIIAPTPASPPSDTAADAGGGRAGEEVSAWASQLLSNLSYETQAAEATATQTKSTLSPGEATAATEVASSAEPVEQALPTALVAAACVVPHPAKVEKGGEDAYFVLDSKAIGVADGVGSWSREGVDVAAYSKELMASTARSLLRGRGEVTCVQALEQAQRDVSLPGSATAIVARLTLDSALEVANIGDSGLRLLRDGKVLFATDALQHEFNMPYQLGCPALLPFTDYASSAEVHCHDVLKGDLVIMGSDGLFDNVWDADIEELVQQHIALQELQGPEALEGLAQALAKEAARNSEDKTFRSPWSVASANSGQVGLLRKLFPAGGKLDDITVVVAQLR